MAAKRWFEPQKRQAEAAGRAEAVQRDSEERSRIQKKEAADLMESGVVGDTALIFKNLIYIILSLVW